MLTRTPQELRQEPWDTTTELLAQVLEVLSVVATETHHLRKPFTVPRPGHVPPGAPLEQTAAKPTVAGVVDLDAYRPTDTQIKGGIAALARTSKVVRGPRT